MAGERVYPAPVGKEDPGDADALPDSTDPRGPCTRCGRISNFTVIGTSPVTFRKDGTFAVRPGGQHERLADERVAILECSGCRDRMVVIEEELTGGRRRGSAGVVTQRGFHWWPTPGASSFGPDVPKSVADAYAEGMRCLSAGAPNGAAAMFRTALTHIVVDKGSAAAKAKDDLKDKLKHLVADGGLPTALGDWATHVRLYGNAAAHPDLFGAVGVDEAQDVAKLTYTLIEVLYVLPGNIARRQAERGKPKP